MSRDDAALLDLARAASQALEFRGSADRREFLRDEKTQSAVLHQLLIVGEAAKRLSPEFCTRHPQVP